MERHIPAADGMSSSRPWDIRVLTALAGRKTHGSCRRAGIHRLRYMGLQRRNGGTIQMTETKANAHIHSTRVVARFCVCGHDELLHDDEGNCANCACGGFTDEDEKPRKDLE
jgi:hypothetical protein